MSTNTSTETVEVTVPAMFKAELDELKYRLQFPKEQAIFELKRFLRSAQGMLEELEVAESPEQIVQALHRGYSFGGTSIEIDHHNQIAHTLTDLLSKSSHILHVERLVNRAMEKQIEWLDHYDALPCEIVAQSEPDVFPHYGIVEQEGGFEVYVTQCAHLSRVSIGAKEDVDAAKELAQQWKLAGLR